MKRNIYDLLIKVKGNNGLYTVRRRTMDQGFECTCPAWNLGRKECHHVSEVRKAVSGISQENTLETTITRVVRAFPFYIPNEDELIKRLVNAVVEGK